MSNTIHYNQVADCLDRAEIDMLASEIHGIACGLLAGNSSADKELVPELDSQNVLQKDAIREMGRLFDDAQSGLQDSEFRFELFLPEDDSSLATR